MTAEIVELLTLFRLRIQTRLNSSIYGTHEDEDRALLERVSAVLHALTEG